MKNLTLLVILGAMIFILGAAPLNGQALDTNTGHAFQTDPTLTVPTVSVPTLPGGATDSPSNPGTTGSSSLLIIGVVILGLILLVLLIWAISRGSHTHE